MQDYPQVGGTISSPVVRKSNEAPQLDPIRQSLPGESEPAAISSPVVRKLQIDASSADFEISSPLVTKSKKSQPVVSQLASLSISASVMRKSKEPLPTPLTPEQVLRFSWTQLIELLRLDDPWKRAFYENECLLGGWSKRQLQRQIGSLLY